MKTGNEEPVFIVAPTERHRSIRSLTGEHGEFSMLPERFGCDILWRAQGDWWGIQRKEIADFIASIQDGRLAREVQMMRPLPMKFVCIEGKLQYTTDDLLMYNKRSSRVTKPQFIGMQISLMDMGINVVFTKDQHETAEMAQIVAKWSMKGAHKSLMRRPGPVPQWGHVTDEEWAIHLLQGFDGLGAEKARAIVKHFGGVPMDWSVSEKELMEVPGIGKTLARRMINALTRVEP